MCHGDVLCRDGTDLEQCSVMSCGYGQTLCSEGTEMTTARECYDTDKGNDGEFDCLNRNDEENVAQETKDNIDFKDFKKCKAGYWKDEGLRCGKACIATGDWCQKDKSQPCKTENSSFNTASPELCRNHTFWKNITCNRDNIKGGWRCEGAIQHCIFHTYISFLFNKRGTPDSYRRCEDKSDQIFRAGSTCNDIALEHLQNYCDLRCQRENKEDERCQKCSDPSSWLSVQTDPYILDPYLCQDSCQTPGQHCEACFNKKYRRCTKDGVTVCYHPDLWCDGHPLCDGAVDEPVENVACRLNLLKQSKY